MASAALTQGPIATALAIGAVGLAGVLIYKFSTSTLQETITGVGTGVVDTGVYGIKSLWEISPVGWVWDKIQERERINKAKKTLKKSATGALVNAASANARKQLDKKNVE